MTDDPAMTDDAAMTKAGAEPVRVAAIQAEAAPGDVAANVATAARLVARAASDGARIVVLSELFLSAYDLTLLGRSTTVDVSADADRAVEDARLDPLRVAASEHGTVVVVGAPVRHADGRRTCSALLVDRAGTTTVAYDKQQLCGPDEKALFVRGDVGVTVAVDGWRFAIGI
ncbi:MAG TPA: carbon-nitrogen hydrolase family protein, partial [Micromonosporaceae bacterium]|nr:carbon-nitrogen hydrolase family protein [Micromonosporaceae bacterium]